MSIVVESACRFAIEHVKKQKRETITADDLLLGCFRSISQFGIAEIGAWSIDLEELGFDWLAISEEKRQKVAYSQEVVELLDQAAKIARASESPLVRVQDLLAAYAGSESGLIGRLKKEFRFTNAQWRAAAAALAISADENFAGASQEPRKAARPPERAYLTPEDAAEILGIHVQTLRAHIRSGKLPALRLAGERAIRIRRSDLDKIFEPATQID